MSGRIWNEVLQVLDFTNDFRQTVAMYTWFRSKSVRGSFPVSVNIGRRLGKWMMLSYIYVLILAILVCTAIFNFMAVTMLYVNQTVVQSCQIFAWICPVCYLGTKNITYMYFMERVYIIRGNYTSRLRFKLYWFHGFLILLCFSLMVTVIVYDTHQRSSAGCQLRFSFFTTTALLVFDSTLNLYLTLLFVIPICVTTKWSPYRARFKNLAKRVLFASIVALLFTVTNLVVCLAKPDLLDKECLLLCCFDLNVSALVVDYSSSAKVEDTTETELTTNGVAGIFKSSA
ncbi:hypothetical protein K493DRAFT_386648 [Basidiobolus meristosporus CBS 931.73]|uniref:G-protein coupled receptors family 1 profile domain-containing protein n=1 Tax=Basidiobolus meristosporus CBS 931.73 TaxID=1314790 RepID=A0A1Y1XJY9_9FUNG|nr:hypothetical protein K493DRAFT_386648 [Basidiobolus meristosporus CBS 931.73]|eukprot:ORX86013.1 hypothetical protein K493DRAFT_386648 [Basidiobolus meristosporus CBS 931.73]